MNLYQILEISSDADFSELKSAYYRLAKRCHPDRFGNCPDKTRQFQELVCAFDILSDPERRHEYDLSQGIHSLGGSAAALAAAGSIVMDHEADEILEELVVGNDLPENSSLATLLADLESTEVFLLYREGRDHLGHNRIIAAEHCFREAVLRAPCNIVFRVHLARVLCRRGRFAAAFRHYREALKIGRLRQPPLLLRKLEREWDAAFRRHWPVRYWFARLFSKAPDVPIEDPADAMVAELNRAIARAFFRKHLPPPEQK